MRHSKSWSRHSRPSMPPAPIKPKKVLTRVEYKRVYSCHVRAYDHINLKDLQLPEGVTLEDISIEVEVFDEDSPIVYFNTSTATTSENPDYEVHMKMYEKEKKEWESKKARHMKELIEWEKWVKFEEEKELHEQLKHAEELLKRHGRIKE